MTLRGNFKHVTRFLAGLSALGALASCNAPLNTLDSLRVFYPSTVDETEVKVNFCTTPAAPIQSNLKYLFVIDNSTSNRTNYKLKYSTDASGNLTASPLCPIDTGANNEYATDPTRERRYRALLDFMTSITTDPARMSDPSRYYGLIEFSTNAMVRSASGGPAFTQDSTAFRNLISQRYSAAYSPGNGIDEGTTDYLAALNLVKSTIRADIDAAKARSPAKSSAYVIVFISDGFPIPGAGLVCQNGQPIFLDQWGNPIQPQSPSQIKQLVSSIVAMEAETDYVDMVSLFTGYMYVDGNEDPGARTLLKDMADVGKGVAYNFGKGQSVDFNLFTLPPRMLRYEVGELFVRDVNSVWWPGSNQILVDTDGDGLPDVEDKGPLYNPNSADANGDGISDLVAFRQATGVSCAGIPAGDDDGDGLSNCEESYLGNSAGRNIWDTNGNLIPDGLEFLNALDFRTNPNGDQADFDFDGLSNRTEIKLGLPATVDNKTLLNLAPLQYETTIVSQTDLQACYQVRVKGLKRMTDQDRIEVQLVERSPAIFNHTKLRTAEGRFAPAASKLTIEMGAPAP